MSEAEQLPDELATLFAVERTAPVADAATRAAAKSRLVAAIAHVPLGTSGAAATLAGAGKVIAIVALTLGVGAGTVALVKHADRTAPGARAETREDEGRMPRIDTPIETLIETAAVQTPSTPTRAPVASTPAVASSRTISRAVATHSTEAAPPSTTTSAVETRPTMSPAADDSPSQAQLLRRAWTALNTGAAADALAIVSDDLRRHPDGSLTEERAALNVLALAKLGRRDEARAASAAFVSRYPTSVHRARIERALEETP